MNNGSTVLTPLDMLAKIGPFLGGIGLLAGAFIGAFTSYRVTRRQAEDAWVDRFRVLYGEFWKEEPIIEVREWVINDNSYKEIEGILRDRNAKERCEVSHTDHIILDKIDRFCSMIARIKSFDYARIPQRQRTLLSKLLNGAFCVCKLRERNELRKYVEKYWPEILM